ncbi:MAG: hypothetical protein KBD21_04115, partial [Candidatus Pacebacteria bacterium]|nr:hypothetical protein [Candidatus Paceibacterota bacterium]
MEKKQIIVTVLALAVGVFIGVGAEEYREHALSDEVATFTISNTSEGMQVYAYPVWGFSVQFPFGYMPRLVQDQGGTLGLRIMQPGSGRTMQEATGEEDCTICAVSISIVRDFLRDEQGMMKTPEEYLANQARLGYAYEDATLAGHVAHLRTDTETGRRDYSIFVKTEAGYDWYHVGVHVDDPEAKKIASTFMLTR